MLGVAASGALIAAGVLAYGVRGPRSTLLAPSVWRGRGSRRAVALTFDDGPSESTPRVLELLARHGARATFFQCGMHARRLPGVARAVADAGHELGNHTETHAALYLRSVRFMRREIAAAQESIAEAAGRRPVLFRAPYGARWFGLGAVQRAYGLTGVMWTAIGRDWVLPGAAVARRLLRSAVPGAIFCLHDGRDQRRNPEIAPTLDALHQLLPALAGEGYEFLTVSEIL
ncbi:MAG: polysaccharide deacetylase family protein [Acidobacteria bacterium]|nr:polysaccharide deacetylase family protein [Acidobacteriota bacterium]